jgi:hypothetical protein
MDFREHPPIFLFVVWVNNLDGRPRGSRMARERLAIEEMAVEESPLGPRRTSRPLIEIREDSLHREPSAGRSEGRTR